MCQKYIRGPARPDPARPGHPKTIGESPIFRGPKSVKFDDFDQNLSTSKFVYLIEVPLWGNEVFLADFLKNFAVCIALQTFGFFAILLSINAYRYSNVWVRMKTR